MNCENYELSTKLLIARYLSNPYPFDESYVDPQVHGVNYLKKQFTTEIVHRDIIYKVSVERGIIITENYWLIWDEICRKIRGEGRKITG